MQLYTFVFDERSSCCMILLAYYQALGSGDLPSMLIYCLPHCETCHSIIELVQTILASSKNDFTERNRSLTVGKTTLYVSKIYVFIIDGRRAWPRRFVCKTGTCLFTFLTIREINRSFFDMHSSIGGHYDSTDPFPREYLNLNLLSSSKLLLFPFLPSTHTHRCLQNIITNITNYPQAPSPSSLPIYPAKHTHSPRSAPLPAANSPQQSNIHRLLLASRPRCRALVKSPSPRLQNRSRGAHEVDSISSRCCNQVP
ncbi:hypothetical protein F4803DRAFT_545373 [Xylaria telfairii]|nr:hypothetical protein F4803DRAFT_545373 [Xylaria telfairii]